MLREFQVVSVNFRTTVSADCRKIACSLFWMTRACRPVAAMQKSDRRRRGLCCPTGSMVRVADDLRRARRDVAMSDGARILLSRLGRGVR